MADRVHPSDSPPRSTSATTSSTTSGDAPPVHPPKPLQPSPQEPVPPPPGTYVIQLPKDQIYRYPPPENARRYQDLTRQKTRRSCCRRCCCFTLCFLLLFIVAAAIAAGIFYLVFRPEAPDYTVSDVAIKGLNLTSSLPISPEFDVSVRANNPNNKIGIYYEKGSEVNVYYGDVNLANGVLPTFYQPSNNVTVFPIALKSSNVELESAVKSKLTSQQRQGRVPFVLKLRAPVKIKVGSIKTWKITVKVDCDIIMDALTEKSRIVSKDCDYDVKLW